MAAPGEEYAQLGGGPYGGHPYGGGAPAGYDPLTWVPPPGWVAPPGWNEYQQFVQFQRTSQRFAYAPVGGPAPVPQQQPVHSAYAPQQPMPGGYMPQPYTAGGAGYPPQNVAAYGAYPPPHAGYPPQYVQPQQQQASPYGYAPHPAQQAGGYYQPVVPHPEAIAAIKQASNQQQQRPAPPPSPSTARPPRVKVEFEDDSSDEEGLARHDTLGVFDLVDVHEISDRDFAQLDTGTEQGVQDAGIIERGIPVQPAITLKDSTSRESTTMPVQSINIDEATLKEVAEDSGDDGEDETTEESDKPENGDSQQVPVSRQNSAAANKEEPGANATPPRRKSTFGTILGAAAAMLGSGSSRRLSTKGSQARATEGSTPTQSGNGEAAAVLAAAGVAAMTVASAGSSSALPVPSPSPEVVNGAMAPAIPPSRGSSFQDLSQNAAASSASLSVASTPASGSTPTPPPAAAAAAGAEDDDEGIVQIKVRTLAGKAAIFEVDKLMTLWEFRELIHEHFNNIPVEEQRLLFKGKMIEILLPETTLQDIGFVNNDLIHLVRTVGVGKSNNSPSAGLKAPSAATNSTISLNSSADDQQIPQVQSMSSMSPSTPAQPLQMLTVLVPPGRGPGDRLRILPQGRGPMLVTVPAGVFAGDRFRVLLPPEDPAEMRRAEQLMQAENQRQQEAQRQQQESVPRPQARPQIMAVVVPKGFKAGQVMDVNVPGKGRVRVTIPSGVKAGQQFKFRLPS